MLSPSFAERIKSIPYSLKSLGLDADFILTSDKVICLITKTSISYDCGTHFWSKFPIPSIYPCSSNTSNLF